jgi:hypothetical protein
MGEESEPRRPGLRVSEGVRTILRQMQAAAEAASPSGLLDWLENLLAGDRRGSLRLQGVKGTLGIEGSFNPIQDLSRTGVCITGYVGILRPGDAFSFELALEEAPLSLRLSGPGLVAWRRGAALGCSFDLLGQDQQSRLEDFLDGVIAQRLEQVDTVIL